MLLLLSWMNYRPRVCLFVCLILPCSYLCMKLSVPLPPLFVCWFVSHERLVGSSLSRVDRDTPSKTEFPRESHRKKPECQKNTLSPPPHPTPPFLFFFKTRHLRTIPSPLNAPAWAAWAARLRRGLQTFTRSRLPLRSQLRKDVASTPREREREREKKNRVGPPPTAETLPILMWTPACPAGTRCDWSGW